MKKFSFKIKDKYKSRVKTIINRSSGPIIPKTKRKEKYNKSGKGEWYDDEEV